MSIARIVDEEKKKRAKYHYEIGYRRFDEGKWQEALTAFNDSLREDGKDPEALYMRARTSIHLNKIIPSEEDLEKINKLIPNTFRAHYLRGLGFYWLGKYYDALKELNKCLNMNLHDPFIQAYKGWAYIGLDNFTAAEAAFKKAIFNSTDDRLYYHYGHGLVLMKRYAEAIHLFDQCLNLNPLSYYAYYYRGYAFYLLKQYEDAEVNFKMCMKVEPNQYDAWYKYALGLYFLKKYDESLLACDETLKLCDELPRALRLKKIISMIKNKLLLHETKKKENIMLHQDLNNKILHMEQTINQLNQELSTLKLKHQEELTQLRSEFEFLTHQVKEENIFKEALFNAVSEKNVKKIQAAADLGNIHTKNEKGKTVLHVAIENGDIATANFLLSLSPLLFVIPDNDHYTPMQRVALSGNLLNLSWIYEESKNVEVFKSNQHEFDSVYEVATSEAKQFLANKRLFDSVKTGNLAGVKDAILKGAEINKKSGSGYTALHEAVDFALHDTDDFKYIEIVSFLLEQGADPTLYTNKTDEDISKLHETALDIAKRSNNSLFITRIATAYLIFAASHGSRVDMLTALHAGAKVDGLDGCGQTALHKAVKANHIECIKFLINLHARDHQDIEDFPDSNHLTPYDLASKNFYKKGDRVRKLDTYMAKKLGTYTEKYKSNESKTLSTSQFSLHASKNSPENTSLLSLHATTNSLPSPAVKRKF